MVRETKLAAGKLPLSLLRKLICYRGSRNRGVVLGPALGEDAAAIKAADGYFVLATDPVTFTAAHSGWYSVHINANDVAVCGAKPLYFQSCIILPPGISPGAALATARDVDRAARALGVAVTGGHTEVSPVVAQPVVAGTMVGFTRRLIRSSGASADQLLVQVGFAGIEGAAILARRAGPKTLDKLSRRERSWISQNRELPAISVVAQALAAARMGASAMHDPTEGGIAAGIHELAMASRCGFAIDIDRVPMREATRVLCAHFCIDPFALLSSGSLLAVMPPLAARRLVRHAARKGWPAAILGRAVRGRGLTVIQEGKRGRLPYPPRDALAELIERRPSP